MNRIQKNRSSKSAVVKSISSWSRCPGHKGSAVTGAGALTRALSAPLLLPALLQSKLARLDPPFTVFYPQDARPKSRFVLMGWLPPESVVSSAGVGASLNHWPDSRQGSSGAGKSLELDKWPKPPFHHNKSD